MRLFEKEETYAKHVLAVDEQGRSVTYRQMAACSDALRRLVGERKLVFLLCENSIACLLAYLSALRADIVLLPLDARIHPQLLKRLEKEYAPSWFLLPERLLGEWRRDRAALKIGDFVLCRAQDRTVTELNSELCLLLETSGSTGSPKLVRQSAGNIDSNAAAIVSYLNLDENERPVTTLPMNYTYGLSVIHSHVMVGATILVTDRSVLEREFWSFVKKERATSLAGVPYTYELFERIGFRDMELPDLRTLTQAGGKLRPSVHRTYAAYAGKSGKRFFVMYGQTEATARMAYLPPERAEEKCGSMGIAVPGGRLWLEDEHGVPVEEPLQSGELVYGGDNVALGYAMCREDLKKGDEWHKILHTGDIAERDEDGFYFITGRKKRFVKLAGNRVNLDEIERLMKETFAGADFACVGDDTGIRIFTDSERREEIADALDRLTGIRGREVRVITVGQIPRNESGKTLYAALAQVGEEMGSAEKESENR